MSAELRRFMPALVVLVILGVAVYAGRSGTLTGSASGAGCVAETGAPVAPAGDSALAQVSDDAREAVSALMQLEVQGDDPRSMQAVDAASATIRDLGAVAVPALASEFGASGCTMSSSRQVVVLIDELARNAPEYDDVDRRTMGEMLLNVPSMAVPGQRAF